MKEHILHMMYTHNMTQFKNLGRIFTFFLLEFLRKYTFKIQLIETLYVLIFIKLNVFNLKPQINLKLPITYISESKFKY